MLQEILSLDVSRKIRQTAKDAKRRRGGGHGEARRTRDGLISLCGVQPDLLGRRGPCRGEMKKKDWLKNLEQQKTATADLWKVGIPGLDLDQETLEKLHTRLSSSAAHSQLKLLQSGFAAIVDDYEKLVHGIENSECEHNGTIRRGSEYQSCCGISYEYLNDLSCRGTIALVTESCSDRIPWELSERIESLDRRFRSVPKRPGWIVGDESARKYQEKNYWWYEGLPLTVLE